MDYIKQWTICICITLITSVIFSIITPKGKMQSFYKIIISAFIFLSFLYPFTTGQKLTFSLDKLDDIIVEEQSSIGENVIDNQISGFLKKEGIEGATVSSSVSQVEDEIQINDIQISVPDEYDKEVVRNLVFDSLGVNTRVIHIGE